MVIKNVLREELSNSLRLMNGYKKKLQQLPKGSLIVQKRKGQEYGYLIVREKGKFKLKYKGKPNKEALLKSQKVKQLRSKYRNLLSKVKKQIAFLRKALRGKAEV